MATCNVCGNNKSLEEMQHPFRYVCKECWNDMVISKKDSAGYVEVDKEALY